MGDPVELELKTPLTSEVIRVAAVELNLPQGRGNGSKNASFEIRKAS